MDEARKIEDDLSLRDQTMIRSSDKRKWEGPSGPSKRSNFQEKKDDRNDKPAFCKRCHATHRGPCGDNTMRCRRCGGLGHRQEDCKSTEPLCYNCRKMGHISTNCPYPKKQVGVGEKKDAVPKAKARAFNMTVDEARQADEVIFGTFLINSMPASVLFDAGASRSFVSLLFCARFVVPRSPLVPTLDIEVAVGEPVTVREKYDACNITIGDYTFPLTLIPIGVGCFDVVIGMDWLSANRAQIHCAEKIVRIPLAEGGYAIAYGERRSMSSSILSVMKARKYIAKGCPVFLAHVVDSSSKVPDLTKVDVVSDYVVEENKNA